jgi:phosphatidylglycerol:prolipoprotein diacylglycerol transferase
MYQVLIDDPVRGLSLRTTHALLLLAVVVCTWHGAHQLRHIPGIDWWRMRRGFLLLAIAPWLGGHAHFLVNHWRVAALSPAMMALPWMGLHAGGAIIALALSAPWVMRHYRLPLGRMADAWVPTVGIGIILGRLGCLAEGCCFGRVCDLPWCISFPKGPSVYELHLSQGYVTADALQSAPVHPLPLYFAAVGGLLIVGGSMRWRVRYHGQLALVALTVFSCAAAVLEGFREDSAERVYWGPLPQLQWTALAMTLASVAALAIVQRRHA